MLSTISIVALIIIAAALALAWSRRFLAVGALVVGNILVFGLTALGGWARDTCSNGPWWQPHIHNELAFCAQSFYAGEPWAFVQLFTSMWVHADLMHLIGNMFLLLVFALVFEDLIGPRRMIIVYLWTGLVAALAQMLANPGAPMLLMGASGAVSGIVGAFAGAHPHMVMRLPIPGPIIFFARMRVITYAILFTLMQLGLMTLSSYYRGLGGVAYAAHLGGLAFGMALGYYWLRHATESKSKPVPIQLEDLERFATDSKTKRAYAEMQANRDEPDVFRAWFDRFWDGARDPETNQRVRPGPRGTILREDGTPVNGSGSAR